MPALLAKLQDKTTSRRLSIAAGLLAIASAGIGAQLRSSAEHSPTRPPAADRLAVIGQRTGSMATSAAEQTWADANTQQFGDEPAPYDGETDPTYKYRDDSPYGDSPYGDSLYGNDGTRPANDPNSQMCYAGECGDSGYTPWASSANSGYDVSGNTSGGDWNTPTADQNTSGGWSTGADSSGSGSSGSGTTAGTDTGGTQVFDSQRYDGGMDAYHAAGQVSQDAYRRSTDLWLAGDSYGAYNANQDSLNATAVANDSYNYANGYGGYSAPTVDSGSSYSTPAADTSSAAPASE